MDVEIEWGFQAGMEEDQFDGSLKTHVSMIGPVSPLPGDMGTTVTAMNGWQSRAAENTSRRGIIVPLLYAPEWRPRPIGLFGNARST
jgi:hypothetical protein